MVPMTAAAPAILPRVTPPSPTMLSEYLLAEMARAGEAAELPLHRRLYEALRRAHHRLPIREAETAKAHRG